MGATLGRRSFSEDSGAIDDLIALGAVCRVLRLLFEPFVWGLSVEAAVGPVEVVEVFPLLQLVVEELGVVDDDAVEHPVELFVVDAV